MDIREYLFRKRLTAKQFAEIVGCSKQHISAIKNGRNPSKWLAMQIERVTEGEIKIDEVRNRETL